MKKLLLALLIFFGCASAGNSATMTGGSVGGGTGVGSITITEDPEEPPPDTGDPASLAFQTLADSAEWGTGGSIVDLTSIIPPFRTHEEAYGSQPALPLDTTGWTTYTVGACTELALEAALTAANLADLEGSIVDYSACDEIQFTGGSQDPFINFTPTMDRVVLRGKAVTGTTWRRVYGGAIPPDTAGDNDGLREKMINISGPSDPSFAGLAWGIDRGGELGSQVVGTDDAMTGVYEGSVLWLGEPHGGSGADNTFQLYGRDTRGPTEIRFVRRVLCARWGGTNYGTDCTGVTQNGDVRLDKPLTMNLMTTGPYDYSDQFTGFQFKLAERHGSPLGATDTDNIREYVGIENTNFEHSHPYAMRDGNGILKFDRVEYFWVKNVNFGRWGNQRLVFSTNNGHGGPGLITQSNFDGEAWAIHCVSPVISLLQTNPVRLVMGATDVCDNWDSNLGNDPIWFPDDFPIAALRGTHGYTVTTASNGVTVTIALAGIDGTGMSTNPGGWGSALRYFSTATVYAHAGVTGVEFADVFFENTRVGVIIQGACETIIGFSEFYTRANIAFSRGTFEHSGGCNWLVEGVRSNAQWFTAKADAPATGPFEGPHQILANSQYLSDGVATNYAYDEDPAGSNVNPGYWQDETSSSSADRLNKEYYGTTVFGSVLGGVNHVIDACDQYGLGMTTGCADNLISGYFNRNNVTLTGNLWPTTNFNVDAQLDSNNPTTVAPETDANDAEEEDELTPALRAREYPTSISRTVVPEWWCDESPSFPGIGASVYDAQTNTNPLIPATLRRMATSCSAVRAYYVSPTGSNTDPGTIDEPWQTISFGVSSLTEGDTLFIRGGTYNEQVVLTESGGAGGAIFIRGYPNETAIIDGTGIDLSDGEGLVEIDSLAHVTLRHLEIQNSEYAGVVVTGESRNIHLLDLDVHHNGSNGIFLEGPDLTEAHSSVEDSLVYNNGRGGITLWKSAGGYFKIEGNTVTNNDGGSGANTNYDGIQIGGGEGATHHVVVRENKISGNGGSSADDLDLGGHGTNHHYLVEHNSLSGAPTTNASLSFKLHSGSLDNGEYTAGVSGFHIARFNRITGHGYTVYAYPNPIALYNNTLYDCGQCILIYDEDDSALDNDLGDSTYTSGSDTGRMAVKNNLFFQNAASTAYALLTAGGGVFDLTYAAVRLRNNLYVPAAGTRLAWTVIYNPLNATTFGNYKASNSPDLPDTGSILSTATSAATFDDATYDNYCLDPASAATGQAAALTTTVGTGTASTTLVVDRASFFVDGYCADGECLTTPDTIVIGAQPAVEIVSINDATNTITLAAARTWTSGLNVTLSSLSLDPDIGGGRCN